jgi:hypothetical protein
VKTIINLYNGHDFFLLNRFVDFISNKKKSSKGHNLNDLPCFFSMFEPKTTTKKDGIKSNIYLSILIEFITSTKKQKLLLLAMFQGLSIFPKHFLLPVYRYGTWYIVHS